MQTKLCQICNKEYSKGVNVCKKQWAKSQVCSLICKGIKSRGTTPYNKNKVSKVCEECTLSFEVSPYRKNTARFCSQRCLALSKKGALCPRWKGGLTAKHLIIRNSDEYKQWRTSVFKRDNFTCIICKGLNGKDIEADHIKLFSKFPELRIDINNGQTLCKCCHREKTAQDLRSNWSNQYYKNKKVEALN